MKVGFFVLLGVFLFAVAILMLGGNNPFWSSERKYVVFYKEVSGLIPGAKVMLNGIRVGAIGDIDFDMKQNSIKLRLDVNAKYAHLVRTDSTAAIATQGVLGDKYIMITAGSQDQPELPDGGEMQTASGSDLSKFITSGEHLIANLDSAVTSLDAILKNFDKKNRSARLFEGFAQTGENAAIISEKLKSSADSLNSILKKIDRGQGTVGALINDPQLYDDVKNLLGGVSRNRVLRNIVRQTVKEREVEEADSHKK